MSGLAPAACKAAITPGAVARAAGQPLAERGVGQGDDGRLGIDGGDRLFQRALVKPIAADGP